MSMSENNVLNINFSCIRVKLADGEKSIERIPNSIMKDTFEQMEQLKADNKITRIENESYPVILSIQNQSLNTIEELKIAFHSFINANKDTTLTMSFDFDVDEIKSKEKHEIILFDMNGLTESLLSVPTIAYKISGKPCSNKFKSNAPFKIVTSELQNPFNGYRTEKERDINFLLENYRDNSFVARGILLNTTFESLKEINKKTFEFNGKKMLFEGASLSKVRAALQLDIISKIMMYTEDLVALLDAIHSHYGDFYQLLDQKTDNDMDLGDRIRAFLERLDSKDNAFTSEDYGRMLSYVKPEEVADPKGILKMRINDNIEAFRFILLQVRSFRNAHRQVFRRYKHAGMAMRPGIIANIPYPYTKKSFDSYAMIFVGNNPLKDVIPLPYSEEVIEAYTCLISTLQVIISDIIGNKLACIERGIEGIIPFESYSVAPIANITDEQEMLGIIDDFYNKHPLRARDNFYNFSIGVRKDESIQWYVELDKFLEQCRKNKNAIRVKE